MFVDELTIYAKAGDGGDGVVRWRHEKFRPMAGPSGGNGGNGGDVYVRAVKDLNRLSKYTGKKSFPAEKGDAGTNQSMAGKNGEDLYIDIPVGSRVTDLARERTFELTEVGETQRILKGGGGGLGNEYFKSSTNQSPEQSTKGKKGEDGEFLIEVSLVVDIGLIGLPNAGKSTLLNNITNAHSRIGAYPFTTLEPHLGDLFGYIIADIPGLISGAAKGKGLGHKFLRHVSRTKMLLHLVSLEHEDPLKEYYTIREELSEFDESLTKKEEWVILTKKDLVEQEFIDSVVLSLEKIEKRVLVVGQNDKESYKQVSDMLTAHLKNVE
ncbi:GTPase ObgE [Candidatus Nomurabacteria bacterium]|nr:GTPase ObgE [Candidatus Kaiserbacteria bacterium]MCB9810006.1 GTPase ObgE [Candidatus Nomurabacteria bacterium]